MLKLSKFPDLEKLIKLLFQGEARHYKHMQEKYEYSTRVLAKKYGEGDAYYKYKLQLLELPGKVVTQVTSNQISETHCRHICKLLNKVKLQKKFEELFAIKFDDWDELENCSYWNCLKV